MPQQHVVVASDAMLRIAVLGPFRDEGQAEEAKRVLLARNHGDRIDAEVHPLLTPTEGNQRRVLAAMAR